MTELLSIFLILGFIHAGSASVMCHNCPEVKSNRNPACSERCEYGCLKTEVELDVRNDDVWPEYLVTRSCSPTPMAVGCRDPVQVPYNDLIMVTTTCFCTGPYCNSAGMAAINLFLLMVSLLTVLRNLIIS